MGTLASGRRGIADAARRLASSSSSTPRCHKTEATDPMHKVPAPPEINKEQRTSGITVRAACWKSDIGFLSACPCLHFGTTSWLSLKPSASTSCPAPSSKVCRFTFLHSWTPFLVRLHLFYSDCRPMRSQRLVAKKRKSSQPKRHGGAAGERKRVQSKRHEQQDKRQFKGCVTNVGHQAAEKLQRTKEEPRGVRHRKADN